MNTNTLGSEPDHDNFFESQFFDCNFDWSKTNCRVDNFAILFETMKLLEQIPCGFNVFQKLALVPAWLSRPVAVSASRSSLWPVPPPLWSWTVVNSPNPKRRKRLRKIKLNHQLLQKVVCMLNWISLGYPKAPPHCAQAGEPTTFEQDRVLETLLGHIDHFCDLEPIARADLGRFGEKFDVLRRAAEELPSHVEVDLEHMLHEIQQQFDSYKKHERPHFADEPQHQETHHACSHQPDKVLVPSLNNKPVIASRIKWKHPPSFDPRPYLLDPVVASVFESPDSLRLPQSVWPSKPKANVHCSRPELLELMKIWDCKGALKLIPCGDVDPHETVGLFAVPKDDEFDRLIINPTVLNSRMAGYSCYTKKLAPGALLSLLSLQDNEVFRYCADDLSDFYYTFKVSSARARRNCIGKKVFASEIQHLSCFDPQIPGPFYPALATLAMGDNHAVEIAQGSHHALLELEASCMRPFETLEYRKPVPRGDFIELLAIDDHIGVQRCSMTQYLQELPLRDTEVFAKANVAYTKVGLVSHPGKQRRHQVKGTLLGADFDGLRGRVSAPRDRLTLLVWISAIICRKGTCTYRLFASLLGCWIHALLFRRPMLSLVDALFKVGHGAKPNQVICLSQHARREIYSLCILACCIQADLRVKTCPYIFALDASPTGGGIVVAKSNETAVAELWRHSEQKGYHTNLLGPASATLKCLGYDPNAELEMGFNDLELPTESVVRPSRPTIPQTLSEGFIYDCVELFRGSGNWSRAHQQHGFLVHDGFDNDSRRLFFKDLLDPSTFHEVLSLAYRRVVREFHAGPPCLTFGTLRRPRLRSKLQPAGFNPNDPITSEHNILARRTAMIGCVAVITGVYFSCEQTGSSVMFRMHCFRVLIHLGCVITRMAFCAFGSGFNKPSQWLHNKGWLVDLESRCNCKWKGRHFVIQGSFTKQSIREFDLRCVPDALTVYGRAPRIGETVASYSAQYPSVLMNRMAKGSRDAMISGPPVIPLASRLHSFARVESEPSDDLKLEPWVDEDSEWKPRNWFEDPEWIGELADSLPFRLLFKYKFKSPKHINVLESHVYASWIKYCAKQYPDSRILGLLDSRVTLGASSKGRSSSFAITRILKQSLPFVIGSNLFPGGLHVYSAQNRADAPSRDREVESPSRPLPGWYQDLCQGDYQLFDLHCQVAQVPRVAGRWLRILLLVAGDVERNPGPKPNRRRGELDLATGFHNITAKRMQKCLAAFETWVEDELGLDFHDVVQDAESCGLSLRAYGLHLYRSGLPRYMLTYAITSMQDQYPHFRHALGAAWQIDKKWQVAEPGHCRPVISLPLFRAAICLSLVWGWKRFAGLSMIAFAGMLHPAEFICLSRKNLMLPRDMSFSISSLYIHLENPKTSRFARQQHVKISDPEILSFVDAVFGNYPLDAKLFGASLSAYRNQWNAVMRQLGVPCLQKDRGLTPGTLRGSGATAMYLQTENIPLICWRGRWAQVKTLEYYLQEVAAQVFIHTLPVSARNKIELFNAACFEVFYSTLHEASSFACSAGS